jgi:hypothetical protein
MSQDRLSRHRSLTRDLEATPPSPERDSLLRELRERISLLEIGAPEVSGWRQGGRPPHPEPVTDPSTVILRF